MSITIEQRRSYLPESHERLRLIQAEVKRVISGPIIAYYPGIGGGEEPVDPLSAFVTVGADYVFGVDPFEYPNGSAELGVKTTSYDLSHVEREIIKHLQETGQNSNVTTEEDEETYRCSFKMNERKRELEIRKIATNALTFIPTIPYNLVYSRRTVGIVANLPDGVLEKAKAIYFTGEGTGDANQVKTAGEQLGFQNIDLVKLTGDLKNTYRSVLLVK